MEYKFSPSLMCMNLLKLEEQITFMNQKAAFYHVDIMDGHYVKNITLSPYFISQIRDIATIPIDAHLMAEQPSDFIEMILEAGADMISPHAETINREAFRIINMIKDRGRKVGIVLNPATPLEYIKHYIHLLDKITILTVDPGFAGQRFIPEMLDKIKEAKELKNKYGYSYLIEVDGSCNKKTFKALKEAGAEVFILGSSGLFNNDPDIEKAWEMMLEQFNNAC
ncbi:MAG: D-allulose 6-phosphate 3-epimerase [Tepidanaerobacteraceae bacterium]|jgi:D-allulose-6-phosphate 3-epimerase|nr:D-allulose 6-phosphate 3-epimerase [Tepidanaerobacteraceae bacterium]